MNAEPVIDHKSIVTPSGRRLIYNGESDNDQSVRSSVGQHTNGKSNRAVKQRKRSPLFILCGVLVSSLLIVFYVWNKISVNRLVVELNDLQLQYQKTLNANELLRAEINKKSSLDRIGKIATEQIGLVYPKEQPIWFEIDEGQLQRIYRQERSEQP